VADAELLRDGIRYSAMCLYCHHRIVRQKCSGSALIEMRDEFVERLHADAACVAMLEEQHWPRLGFNEEPVEVINVLERS